MFILTSWRHLEHMPPFSLLVSASHAYLCRYLLWFHFHFALVLVNIVTFFILPLTFFSSSWTHNAEVFGSRQFVARLDTCWLDTKFHTSRFLLRLTHRKKNSNCSNLSLIKWQLCDNFPRLANFNSFNGYCATFFRFEWSREFAAATQKS